MNRLLWILQAVLAFLYLAGGAYKLFAADELATTLVALPRGGWAVLGIIEMAGAVLLIVPAALRANPSLSALAATVLAGETCALAALYARASLEFAPTNPLWWAAFMALLAAFVAYARLHIRPID
ncbi:MAG: DoxX family protein [Dehalococcoidia bacterium]|nr:DoxX family protein [Dehalococcoidia bacterium]